MSKLEPTPTEMQLSTAATSKCERTEMLGLGVCVDQFAVCIGRERSQSPQRAADDWVAAPADAPTSAVHEPRLPDAFKDSSTTAHTIGEMHEMYAAMFDYTEIEVGQPLDFVRPLSDWVVPDIASAIPQLDVSSKFFHDFQQRSN
jgi:hypothetical protein